MVVALLACTCPSFDEMEVVAMDTSATDDRLATVREALADFAAWTGDYGVCVPEIRLQDDLPEPIGEDGEFAGEYHDEHNPIRLDADSGGLRLTTFHELCHASDRLEGHSDARAWPEVADRSLYKRKYWVAEDFALACEGGPPDVTLDRALVAACGTEPALDENAYYLADVVFPDAPSPGWSDAPYTYSETATAWEGLQYGVGILDARVVDDEVLFLLWTDSNVYVVAFDTTLTELRWQTVIAKGVYPLHAGFVGADIGRYVALWLYGDHDEVVEVVEADQNGVVGTTAIENECVANPMAIVGGVLYCAQDDTIVASTLGGEPVALEPPEDLFARPLDVTAVWPEGDGVAFYVAEGLGRYNAEDSSWSVEPAIGEVATRVDLGDGRALVNVSGTPARWFVYEGGTYAFLGDPCTDSAPDFGNFQFGVDGRLVWFNWTTSEEGPVYVLDEAILDPH